MNDALGEPPDTAQPATRVELPPTYAGFHRALRIPYMRYAHRKLGTREDAEDVVAEAFVRIHVKWDEALRSDSVEAFGWHILKCQIIDHQRRRRCRPVIIQPFEYDGDLTAWAFDPGTIDALLLRIDVHKAIHDLPAKQSDCVVLTYLLGYSQAEAGAVMGIKATTVGSHLQSARRTLEKTLHEYMPRDDSGRKDPR